MDGTTGCHKALCNFKSPEACSDGVHISFSSVIEHYSIRKKKNSISTGKVSPNNFRYHVCPLFGKSQIHTLCWFWDWQRNRRGVTGGDCRVLVCAQGCECSYHFHTKVLIMLSFSPKIFRNWDSSLAIPMLIVAVYDNNFLDYFGWFEFWDFSHIYECICMF